MVIIVSGENLPSDSIKPAAMLKHYKSCAPQPHAD